MRILFYKSQKIIQFIDSVIDIIRVLEQMPESLIFMLNPVDALWSKDFRTFSYGLLPININNLRVGNYPTKNCCRIIAGSRFSRAVLPIS